MRRRSAANPNFAMPAEAIPGFRKDVTMPISMNNTGRALITLPVHVIHFFCDGCAGALCSALFTCHLAAEYSVAAHETTACFVVHQPSATAAPGALATDIDF